MPDKEPRVLDKECTEDRSSNKLPEFEKGIMCRLENTSLEERDGNMEA